MTQARQTCDVVVIGAGAAGLAAASTLAAAGVGVVVLEARNRIGGRILSSSLPRWPEAAELGAEFVHGRPPRLLELAARAGCQLEAVPEQHWVLRQGRLQAVPDWWERVEQVASQIDPQTTGSVAAWLRGRGAGVSPAEAELLIETVRGFHAADPRQMSARTLAAATAGDDSQHRPQTAYTQLLQPLIAALEAARVPVQLRTPVHRIRWRRGEAEIASGAAAEAWRARAVVVTVPLGVLQATGDLAGSLLFTPSLPDREASWRRMGWGHAARVLLRFDSRWWQDSRLPAELRADDGRGFGFVHGAAPFPVWWARAPAPVLVGWWGGPDAGQAAASWRDEQWLEQALAGLARAVEVPPDRLAPRLVDWRRHDWTRDRYSLGAYSYVTAGSDLAPELAGQPVEDTLFFAGEAFATGVEAGTVHGALHSGERTATRLLGRL